MKKPEHLLVGAAASLALNIPYQAGAQELDLQDPTLIKPDPALRIAVLGANIVGNSVLCSIVSFINKQDVLDDTATCFGGAILQSAGMEIGMHEVPALPGFALRMVETGTSIIENTLAGREPFEKLHYELGPVLFEIDTNKGETDVYWRILPAYGYFYNFGIGNKLDYLNTLSHQNFVFNQAEDPTKEKPRAGFATGGIITYHKKSPQIRSHEFNHAFQYVRLRPLQLLVPGEIDFLEDTLHLRLGEDLGIMFFQTGVGIGCLARPDDAYCGRRTWNLLELESYIMETAYENYIGE